MLQSRNLTLSRTACRLSSLFAAAGAVLLLGQQGRADTIYWQGGIGDWFNANNWFDNDNGLDQVPASSDGANIENGGTVQISSGSAAENGIDVDFGSAFILNGNAAISNGGESVGITDVGIFNQCGGTNTIYGGLSIGYGINSTGTYLLGGASTLMVSGTEVVGYYGSAIFNQSSGVNSSSQEQIGGIYNQSGGTNTISGGLGITDGTYNLSATGSLLVIGSETIAQYYGSFTQSGGVNICSGFNSGGGYSLSATGIILCSGSESVTSGNFNQSGGTNTCGSFYTAGEYSLCGTGTLSCSGSEAVGGGVFNQRGIFNQSGGANSINNGLTIGSTGVYMLSGTGSLSAAQEYIGAGGKGTFNQSGGTNTTNNLSIAVDSAGTYTLSGGTVTCSNLYVGGSFMGSGGTGVLTVSNFGQLAVAGTMRIWNTGRANLDAPNTTVGNLSIYENGIVNLNGALTINYGSPATDPVSAIVGYLQSGYNGGKWTGMAGIISTSAQNQSGPALSVGYADGNTDTGTPAGSNQIVVKYTLAGDANLDGLVNFADLVAVVQNFNKGGTDWAHGNFGYGSLTNFVDLVAVVQNFNKILTPAGSSGETDGGTMIPLGTSESIESTDVQLPEPSASAIVVCAAGLLGGKRRRGNRHSA